MDNLEDTNSEFTISEEPEESTTIVKRDSVQKKTSGGAHQLTPHLSQGPYTEEKLTRKKIGFYLMLLVAGFVSMELILLFLLNPTSATNATTILPIAAENLILMQEAIDRCLPTLTLPMTGNDTSTDTKIGSHMYRVNMTVIAKSMPVTRSTKLAHVTGETWLATCTLIKNNLSCVGHDLDAQIGGFYFSCHPMQMIINIVVSGTPIFELDALNATLSSTDCTHNSPSQGEQLFPKILDGFMSIYSRRFLQPYLKEALRGCQNVTA